MFDGRWRSTFENGLRPIGAQIRRTGITANQLTLTGLAMATAASLTIAQGWLRAGLILLILTAIPAGLAGAVAKAPGWCGSEHSRRRYSRIFKWFDIPPPSPPFRKAPTARAYRTRWRSESGKERQSATSIFLGRSFATSVLVRRSVCGSMIPLSSSMREISSSVSASMGLR